MTGFRWLTAPVDFQLDSQQVDVWRVFLTVQPDSVQRMESALSADESQRASRFHFETDRQRYIVAHASLSGILAHYLQCEPHVLKFSANDYGKPFLPDHNIEFNLSHSGDFALVAVARGRRVGVDVEFAREEGELVNLATRYFSPREGSELMALPPGQRTRGFFHGWTRKEAYIKAQGLGLSLPLDSFDVSLGEPAVLHATRPDTSEAARWSLHSIEVGSNYTAALAVEGEGLEIRYWDRRVNQ